MDIQERLELEERKAREAADAKVQAKLTRQLRIFKKEKDVFTHVTTFEKSKQERCLKVLFDEKKVELERYLAVKAPGIEIKERYEAGIVKNLVKTRGIIQNLLASERVTGQKIDKEMRQVSDAIVGEKKATMKQDIENKKFRIPDQLKMDKRVQNANASYHTQRHRNMALQREIDSAIISQKCFLREEVKLKKELNELNHSVIAVMRQASEIFQERELMEATKSKVHEHLAKVKEKFERELLSVTLGLNDDKKAEDFMRTKVKDNAQPLRDERMKENESVETMLQRKDEFCQAFDNIREAMDKDDINDIVQEFLEQEEDNFATFLNIGALMEKNEKLRCDIQDLSQDNFEREDTALDSTKSHREEIKAVKEHTVLLKKRIQDSNTRMEEISRVLQEFLQHLQSTITLLKIDQSTLDNMVGRDAVMNEKNVLKYLEVIMLEINVHLDDLTMVEVATRASQKSDPTPDESMLVRKPSMKIAPIPPQRTIPLTLSKGVEHEGAKRGDLMVHSDLRDIALKDLMAEPNKGLGHLQRRATGRGKLNKSFSSGARK